MTRVRDRLRGPFGSRLWCWSSFILVAVLVAVILRQGPGGDCCGQCRDWSACFGMVTVGALLLSGGPLALSLLLLGWSRRTRPWVCAGGLVLTLFALMALWYRL
jgi:hypothetical protein